MQQCPHCNYCTKSTANLHRHLGVHRKTFFGNFRCSICNYGSTRKENVIRHLARKHNNKGVVITGPIPKQAPIPYPEVMFVANFQCNECNYSSTHDKDVMRHRLTAHNDQSIQMLQEKESPKSHPAPPPEPLPDPCPYQLASPDTQHKIIFAANFQCSACNYKSVKKENVIKHQFEKHGQFEEEFAQGRFKNANAAKNLATKSIKVEDDDESEPAKRLLLAECGLIWHSDKSVKKELES